MRQDEAQPLSRIMKRVQSSASLQPVPYWLSAVLTGLAAVAYARSIQWLSVFPAHLFETHRWSLAFLTPVCFLAGWWLVYYFAPEAAGSGIPQVMAAHDLDHERDHRIINRLLGLRTLVIKVLSSFFCILGGGAIGREGPTIQIAASIFHAIGTSSKKLWPTLNHRSWIVAGGAAGIASAFNTPLGGIVYAIEELSSTSFGQFRSLLISAVIISGLVAQWIMGPYLYLGYPNLNPVTLMAVPLSIGVGAICGLSGAIFGKALYHLALYRATLKRPLQLVLMTAATGLGFAMLAIWAGKGTLGSGIELITDLLFHPNQDAHWRLIIARFFGSVLSYISGCAGGIFAPSLSIGGTIGTEIARLIHSGQPRLIILLGMIGFLTGVTRAPFTSFVLVLEMTDHHSAIFPMMVAAVTAQGCAKLIDSHSFYEHMKVRYLHPLEASTLAR